MRHICEMPEGRSWRGQNKSCAWLSFSIPVIFFQTPEETPLPRLQATLTTESVNPDTCAAWPAHWLPLRRETPRLLLTALPALAETDQPSSNRLRQPLTRVPVRVGIPLAVFSYPVRLRRADWSESDPIDPSAPPATDRHRPVRRGLDHQDCAGPHFAGPSSQLEHPTPPELRGIGGNAEQPRCPNTRHRRKDRRFFWRSAQAMRAVARPTGSRWET